MATTCSVTLRPPEGTDLAEAAAALAAELDPLARALSWGGERFHASDPWLAEGAIEVHTRVGGAADALETVARDTLQCAALGALASVRRPDWLVTVEDGEGVVERLLGARAVSIRGGRLLDGQPALPELLAELDELARLLEGEALVAPVTSLSDEDEVEAAGSDRCLWTWQAPDPPAAAPALRSLALYQDEGADPAWTRAQLDLLAPPEPAWRLLVRCVLLGEDGVPLGELDGELDGEGAAPGAPCPVEVRGAVPVAAVAGVAVFVEALRSRAVWNGEAPSRWRIDADGDRWIQADVPVRNDGVPARLLTEVTWLDRDGAAIETDRELQPGLLPPGTSLVHVDEPRMAWRDDDQRVAAAARVRVLAADPQRDCLGVAWSHGRWSPLPGLYPLPVG